MWQGPVNDETLADMEEQCEDLHLLRQLQERTAGVIIIIVYGLYCHAMNILDYVQQ